MPVLPLEVESLLVSITNAFALIIRWNFTGMVMCTGLHSCLKSPKSTGHSLSGVVPTTAFWAGQNAVALDQEPAWRLVLISHAAHIDVNTGLSTMEKSWGGTSWQKQLSISQHVSCTDFGQVKCSTFPPSKVAQRETGGLPERLRLCVFVWEKEYKKCVWQRSKHNRCMWVPTRATDADLTFTQT